MFIAERRAPEEPANESRAKNPSRMTTRDNEMQRLKVRDVEELGHARILGNAGEL
jgi:hypothetical protein